MPLEDFQGESDEQSSSSQTSDGSPTGDSNVGQQLEEAVKDAFNKLDRDSSKSFHYDDGKVVADRQELVEDVMMLCAITAEKVDT